jgi:CRP/FNR family transcriptional regulator
MTGFGFPDEILQAAEVRLAAGQPVFSQGQEPQNYLIVLEGSVKVFARSGEGREVVLYRVRAGEMCLLTTACLIGHTRYSAEAITEEPTVAKAVPAAVFERVLDESEAFRRFVFEGLSLRLAAVTARFEHLVLDSVGQRLVRHLVRNADAGNTVATTHEALALEIGTAREVVTRHLKALEAEGLLRTGRGRIEILEPAALTRRLSGPV